MQDYHNNELSSIVSPWQQLPNTGTRWIFRREDRLWDGTKSRTVVSIVNAYPEPLLMIQGGQLLPDRFWMTYAEWCEWLNESGAIDAALR